MDLFNIPKNLGFPKQLYIIEQGLFLNLNDPLIFCENEQGYIVIVAYENFVRNGHKEGNLMAGIIKRKVNSDYELILPFTTRLIYAEFKEKNSICLKYMEKGHLKQKIIKLNEEGKLEPYDYAFLLEPEKILKRTKALAKAIS